MKKVYEGETQNLLVNTQMTSVSQHERGLIVRPACHCPTPHTMGRWFGLTQLQRPAYELSGARASDAVACPLHNFFLVTPCGHARPSPAVHLKLKG
jgi:hypothetical protein